MPDARSRVVRAALRWVPVAVLGAAVPALLLLTSPASRAEDGGSLRIGHLSSRTPAVDVYLTGPGLPASRTPAATGVAYGDLGGYRSLAPGRWTVELRATGTSPDGPAPAATSVDVRPGGAQSLLFFDAPAGAPGPVRSVVTADDLTPAAAGTGRVRIVQGDPDAATVRMQARDGPLLADGLAYGATTGYVTVGARRWTVAIDAGAATASADLDVTSGSVATVVLTRAAAGGLAVRPIVDVAGSAVAAPAPAPSPGPALPVPATPVPATPGPVTPGPVTPVPGTPAPVLPGPSPSPAPVPRGPVEAGEGGTAREPAPDPDPAPLLAALLAAVAAVAAVSRRRSAPSGGR